MCWNTHINVDHLVRNTEYMKRDRDRDKRNVETERKRDRDRDKRERKRDRGREIIQSSLQSKRSIFDLLKFDTHLVCFSLSSTYQPISVSITEHCL